jgi:hypothetical protein
MHSTMLRGFTDAWWLIRFLSLVDHLYAGEDKGRDYDVAPKEQT